MPRYDSISGIANRDMAFTELPPTAAAISEIPAAKSGSPSALRHNSRRGAKRMLAAQIHAPGQARLIDAPLPQPGPEEVRVRIEGCGVCGSNLPVWRGRTWFSYPRPAGEPGHEGWGVVDEVGSAVQNLRVGERVAMVSYRAFAEFDIAPAGNVVPLPEQLSGMPFPGEALGCAINVFRRSGIERGQTVAVVGIGFLGAVLTALCSRAGATVIAVSRRNCALALAKKMGAAEALQLDERGHLLECVRAYTRGEGCPRVIEAAGVQSTLDLASELAAQRGRLIIAGFHQDGMRQVNMQDWNWRGLDVINAHERDPKAYCEGIRLAAEAVAAGHLDPEPLYTHCFHGLDHLGDALDALEKRPDQFLKGLLLL